MKDHIMRFVSEQDAKVAMPQFVFDGEWDASRVIAPIQIVTAEAEIDDTDPENVIVLVPRETLPGYWLAIALPEVSPDLRGLGGEACRLIADRDLAAAGQPFFVYVAPSVDAGLLATARIEPVFAGNAYSFETA